MYTQRYMNNNICANATTAGWVYPQCRKKPKYTKICVYTHTYSYIYIYMYIYIYIYTYAYIFRYIAAIGAVYAERTKYTQKETIEIETVQGAAS